MTARAEDSYAAITTIVVHSSAFIDPNSALLDLDQHDLYCWKWKRSTLGFKMQFFDSPSCVSCLLALFVDFHPCLQWGSVHPYLHKQFVYQFFI